jgi:hypothetical protein
LISVRREWQPRRVRSWEGKCPREQKASEKDRACYAIGAAAEVVAVVSWGRRRMQKGTALAAAVVGDSRDAVVERRKGSR